MRVAAAVAPMALLGEFPKMPKTMGINGLSWEHMAVNNAPRQILGQSPMSISEWQP
jgi:hypothetical protein